MKNAIIHHDTILLSHINYIVKLINIFNGNIIGDIVYEALVDHPLRVSSICSITCNICKPFSEIVHKIISLNYINDLIIERTGYRVSKVDDVVISFYQEQTYRCWLPITHTNGLHRSINLTIITCDAPYLWFQPNEHIIPFDIDSINYNKYNMLILNPIMLTIPISCIINRIKAKRFCCLPIDPSVRHVLYEKYNNNGIMTNWNCVSISSQNLRRAVHLVEFSGWTMDDFMGGANSWVVASWYTMCHNFFSVRLCGMDEFNFNEVLKMPNEDFIQFYSNIKTTIEDKLARIHMSNQIVLEKDNGQNQKICHGHIRRGREKRGRTCTLVGNNHHNKKVGDTCIRTAVNRYHRRKCGDTRNRIAVNRDYKRKGCDIHKHSCTLCTLCNTNFDNRDMVVILSCGHIFHATAKYGICDGFCEWLVSNEMCPTCHRSFS